jgi:transcriptional regulator NrdR family protein
MEAIQCGLCLEQYTENGRRMPLNIPCGHSACMGCLENIRNSCCPFCRKKFSGTIKNFSRNLTVIGLIDTIAKYSPKSGGSGLNPRVEASKMSTEELRAHNRHIEEELAKREREIKQLADLRAHHSQLRNDITQMRATIQNKMSEMRQVENDVHELESKFNGSKTQFIDDSGLLIFNLLLLLKYSENFVLNYYIKIFCFNACN